MRCVLCSFAIGLVVEAESSKLVRDLRTFPGNSPVSPRTVPSPSHAVEDVEHAVVSAQPDLMRTTSGFSQPASPTHRVDVHHDLRNLSHAVELPAMTTREGPRTIPAPHHDDDVIRASGIGCGVDEHNMPNYIKLQGGHHWVMSTDYPGSAADALADLHLEVGHVLFHCVDGYTLDGKFPGVDNQMALAKCGNSGWSYYTGSFNREKPEELQAIDYQNPLTHIECKPAKCLPIPPAVNADVFHYGPDGADDRHGQRVQKAKKKEEDEGLRNGDVVTYVAHEHHSVDGITRGPHTNSIELECYLGLWFDVDMFTAMMPGQVEEGVQTAQTARVWVKPPALKVHKDDSRVEQVVMLPLSCQPGAQAIFEGEEGVSIKEGSLKPALIGGSTTVTCEEGYWFDQEARVASRTVPCVMGHDGVEANFEDAVGTSCKPAHCVVDPRFGDFVKEGTLTIGKTAGLSTLRKVDQAVLVIAFNEKVTAECVAGASMFGERAGQQFLEATCLASGEVTPAGPCRPKSCTHELDDDVIVREHTKTHTVECPEGTVHANPDPRFAALGPYAGRVTLEGGHTNFRTVFECDASDPDDNWHCTEGCSATDPHTRVPNCKPIMCEVPVVDNGGFVEPEGDAVPYGRSGVLHCPTGSLILKQPTLDLGLCGDEGKFANAPAGPLSCDKIEDFCTELEAQHTTLTEWADDHSLVLVGPSTSTSKLGDTFQVKCKDGSAFSTAVDVTGQQPGGEVEVTCNQDENHKGVFTWSYAGQPKRTLEELACDPVTCAVPATLSNAHAQSRAALHIDDVVEFACPEGMVVVGGTEEQQTSFVATCGPDGELFNDHHPGSKDLPEWPRCVARCGDPLDHLPKLRQVLRWTGKSDIHCGEHCAAYQLPLDGTEWGGLQCAAKHTLTPKPHPLVDAGDHLTCGEDGVWTANGKPLAGQAMDLLDKCGRHLRVTRELAELHRAGRYVQAAMCLGLSGDLDRVELLPCSDEDPSQRFFFTSEQLDVDEDVVAAEGQLVSALPTASGGHRCLSSAVQEDAPGVIKKLSPIQAAVEPCRQAGEGDRRLSYSDGELSTSWEASEQHFGYTKSRGDGGNVEYDMWMLRNKQAAEHTVLVRGFLYIPYAPMTIELKDLPVVANPTHHTHQYVFCYGIHCAEYDLEPQLFPRMPSRSSEM